MLFRSVVGLALVLLLAFLLAFSLALVLWVLLVLLALVGSSRNLRSPVQVGAGVWRNARELKWAEQWLERLVEARGADERVVPPGLAA